MKIGTITFHWATNYGAVIQAYALQEYLRLNNFETEIINYIPLKIKLIQILVNIRRFRITELIKEIKINEFRKEFLMLSKNTYLTNKKLIKKCQNYDIYICGSDQIWNESFTQYSEFKPNLSYYLNFTKIDKTRVAYAASFGVDVLSPAVKNLVKPDLERFNSISVREFTGKEIIEEMNLIASLVVDPTLLLERDAYEKVIKTRKSKIEYQLFSYILHTNQLTANKVDKYIFSKYFDKDIDKKYNQEPIGIVDWLNSVKNCKLVLTNSFHGVVFAIIFNKKFIVIPVEGSNMNNRVTTLLHSVGLENRIIDSFNESKIDDLMNEPIEWEQVESRVNELREGSIEFLKKALGSSLY